MITQHCVAAYVTSEDTPHDVIITQLGGVICAYVAAFLPLCMCAGKWRQFQEGINQATLVAMLFTKITMGYVILCYTDASMLQRATITLCNVHNISVHKGHDRSMNSILTQFIASANLFAINMVH